MDINWSFTYTLKIAEMTDKSIHKYNLRDVLVNTVASYI